MIKIDYSRDSLVTDFAKQTLKEKYMLPEEKSPQDAFARAAQAFADDDDHAQRIYDYVSQQWAMFSSPILANGGTRRGQPISCFLSYVDDSLDGLVESWGENVYLTTGGGGIGNYFGAVRSDGVNTSRGTRSTGVIGFIKTVETQMLAYSQGNNRRGAAAVYLDISHPEIEEFIHMRKPGGDPNRKALARTVFHHAVNIPDAFMDAVVNGLKWDLVDPKTKKVLKEVDARELWFSLLQTRIETGEPYLHFVDTSNRFLPQALKDKGFKIFQSNLCNEIYLPTSKDRTAVCCLSSVNLEKYDEWKDNPIFIEDWIRFLDNVIESFVDSVVDKPGFRRAFNSAFNSRDLGLGTMGFHAYLQSKGIPFESAIAKGQNIKMFQHIALEAIKASKKLAKERGEAPDMVGTGMRNAHLMAVAPNATSSIIANTSPSIELYASNIYSQQTDGGTDVRANPYLEALLEKYAANTPAVLKSIKDNEGSVQHLAFLTDYEKDVFKTSTEIDQMWVIEHAAARQPFIDQGQSVNLFFPSGAHKKDIHKVHMKAWSSGLKGLYYLRSRALRRATNVGQTIERQVIDTGSESNCLGCEG